MVHTVMVPKNLDYVLQHKEVVSAVSISNINYNIACGLSSKLNSSPIQTNTN